MVNSGSSANLVMVAALKKYFNWQDNDEILVSVVGFPTTLNPIIQNNLKPVFVDIEFDTLNFDLNQLESKITKNTKAIMPVHLYGRMCDMDEILNLAEKHGLVVIEDAAQAFSSKHGEKYA